MTLPGFLTRDRLLAMGIGLAIAVLALTSLRAAGWIPFSSRGDGNGIIDWNERAAQAEVDRIQVEHELRERVKPKSPIRPFDSTHMSVAPSALAEEELGAMLNDLRSAGAGTVRNSYWECMARSKSAAERLSLFQWRFGTDPHRVRGWASVESAANSLLAEGERPPDGTHEENQIKFGSDDTYTILHRALLLELAGRTEQAESLLASVAPHTGCGNCNAERRCNILQRRSEFAARRGDWKGALELLHSFAANELYWQPVLVVIDPFEGTWRGMLLLENGGSEEGVFMLQQVADLFPGTPGANVGLAALEQVGALIAPSAERAETVYISTAFPDRDSLCQERKWQRDFAITAIADYRPVDAYERLQEWSSRGNAAAFSGLIKLHDERARPLFEARLNQVDLADLAEPMRALAGLEGGFQPYVGRCLERLASVTERWVLNDAVEIDEVLRSSCGGGPKFEGLDLEFCQDFVKAWQAWLVEHPLKR